MIIKIADGSEVEITFGASKAFLAQDVFGVGVGPFLIVGQEGDLPVLELAPASEGVEAKLAAISPELIAAVATPDDKRDVRLPSGEVVRVDASVAPVLEAIIAANSTLLDQLGKLLSGEEVAGLKRELEVVRGELGIARAQIEQFRGLLPVLEEVGIGIQKVVEGLRG